MADDWRLKLGGLQKGMGMSSSNQSGLNPLWDFAVALYSNPAVEETALRLQSEHGLNVNLLLWSCWLDANDWPPSEERIEQAKALIAPIQSRWVEPIRALRREASGNPDLRDLKAALLSAELEAEKQVLLALHGFSESRGDKPQSQNMVFISTKKLKNVSVYFQLESLSAGNTEIIEALTVAINGL